MLTPTTTDVHQPLRMPGQEAEEFAVGNPNGISGRFYNRARWYRPLYGRYTQADPLQYASGSYNLYSFAANDAVNGSDPSGLFCISYGGFAFSAGGLALGTDALVGAGAIAAFAFGGEIAAAVGAAADAGYTFAASASAAALSFSAQYLASVGGAMTEGSYDSAVMSGAEGGSAETLAVEAVSAGAPGASSTIGDLLSGYDSGTFIHLTPSAAEDFAGGVQPGTYFAQLGDVSGMTVPEFQANVVGGAAAAGPAQAVNGFVTAAPGTLGAFSPIGVYNNAGVMEYTNGQMFNPSSYVALPLDNASNDILGQKNSLEERRARYRERASTGREHLRWAYTGGWRQIDSGVPWPTL